MKSILRIQLLVLFLVVFLPHSSLAEDTAPTQNYSSETLIKLKEEAARQELISDELKKITKEATTSKNSAEQEKNRMV